MVLDETDKEIVSILRKEGRTSYKKISEALCFSVMGAKKRVDKLLKEGLVDVNVEALQSKPKTFNQILTVVGFTYNTLQQRLDQLIDRGLIERYKQPQKGPGRPVYLYNIP